MHLSSSGMWIASIDMGSSQSMLQPLMSDNLRAWTWRDWLGTRAHWLGFRHWTFNLGGNWEYINNWKMFIRYIYERIKLYKKFFYLWHDVAFRIHKNRRRQRQSGRSSSQLNLKNFFTGGFYEDGRKKFRLWFHFVLVAGFLSLASKTNVAGCGVYKASDEHTLRCTFSWRVTRYFVVQFDCSNHVTALTIYPVKKESHRLSRYALCFTSAKVQNCNGFSLLLYVIVIVGYCDRSLSNFALIKLVAEITILSRYPTDVNVWRILSREYSYTVKVLVHKFQALGIEWFVACRFNTRSLHDRHGFLQICVSFSYSHWLFVVVGLKINWNKSLDKIN